MAGTKTEGAGVDRRRGQDGVVGGYLERVTYFCGAAFERWFELVTQQVDTLRVVGHEVLDKRP